MALEVKVYREITDYQAKVIFGLSWRQVAAVAVMLPVCGGLYALCYAAGWDDLGVVLVCVCAVPAALYGWVRPMGVPFEKYVGYWWAHNTGVKVFTFYQSGSDVDEHKSGTKARKRNRRKTRLAYARFEATN